MQSIYLLEAAARDEAEGRQAGDQHGFDKLAVLAAGVFDVRMAAVFLDGAGGWFNAPEAAALAPFAAGGRVVLEDAAGERDPHPLARGGVRFYAAEPLVTSDGARAGLLAVADARPRAFGEADRLRLAQLAAVAAHLLDLRRRSAREAADRTARFQLMARATNDAVWDWDLRSNAVWRSEGYLRLFGQGAGEAGQDWWERSIHPDDRERVVRAIHGVIERGEMAWADEYRFLRGDGRWADVFDRGFVMRDEDGRPARMIGAMTDVSERKRGERAQTALLRIAEAAGSAPTLHELLRSIHEVIADLMPARNFYIALSRRGTDTIDFPYLVDERDPDKKPRNVGRGLTGYVLRTGEPLLLRTAADFDELVRRGEVEVIGPRCVSWVGVPLEMQDRTVGVLVAQSYADGVHYGERDRELLQFVSTQVARAIERKQAQESLQKSERRFRALIENSSDGTAVFSAEGAVVYRSPSVPHMMGYLDEEVIADVSSLIHPDDLATFQSKWAQILSNPGVPIHNIARVRHRDGFFRMLESINVNLLGDPEVGGIVCNFRDVTERKQIEAQLMAADRMVSVGTLAAGVAHEINNPLAYVVANLALAVDALAGVQDGKLAETREALREAQEGAERVRQIVRDLKTFSRPDEAPAGAVDVHQVIDASINMAWNEIRHRARLVKDYGRGLPPAVGNEPRLGQVFLNLLVNAAQAMPEGAADRNEIRITTSLAGANLVVEVKDTGSGIAPEHLGRLFDPFFTTKPVGVGTGLGLFICQGIVRALGGELSVESEVGKGSSFRVVLPQAPEAAAPVAAPAPAEPAPAPRGRILGIDDEPLVGAVLSRALAAHEVVTTTSAAEALARIRGGARFDVIFCDLMMPHMTGMDFFAALSEQDPEQARKVVFLTGGAFTARAHEFLERTEARTVEKPFDLKSIRALVSDLLRA